MKRGLTLIETIMATFIISLVTMAVFNIFPSSAWTVKRAESELYADSVAMRHLEEQRARPFSELALGSSESLPDESSAGTTFHAHLEIEEVADSSPEVLKALRVRVQWKHSDREYRLTREAWVVSVEN